MTKIPELLATLRNRLKGFFTTEETEETAPPVYWDEGVSLTLANLVQETETRASGRVQVISLADFRTSIGDLWEKYKNKILIIAESTIGRMIGKGNTYIAQGDDAWLLLFVSLPEDKAQERSDAIAATLGEKLMGAQFTEHELPLPQTSRLDLSDALNADGSLDMEAVKRAISKIRQKQITSTVAAHAPGAGPAGGRPVAAPAGKMMRSDAEKFTTYFQPAWSAETESIDTFFFRAVTADGTEVYANDNPAQNDATILDLTRTATAAFTSMCGTGLNAKMAIPVPFSALQGNTLKEIQRLIISLGQRERLLRLRLEIVQIPPSATADMLVPIRELFRPYVREVAFVVDLFTPIDQILALDHIMIGTDARTAAEISEEGLFQDLLMFRQRAGRRGTYVLGLATKAHLRRAINAGLVEVGGPALGENTKRLPHRVTILHREQLTSSR